MRGLFVSKMIKGRGAFGARGLRTVNTKGSK